MFNQSNFFLLILPTKPNTVYPYTIYTVVQQCFYIDRHVYSNLPSFDGSTFSDSSIPTVYRLRCNFMNSKTKEKFSSLWIKCIGVWQIKSLEFYYDKGVVSPVICHLTYVGIIILLIILCSRFLLNIPLQTK